MIHNEQLLEAVADAIRCRRRVPQAIFPHPFEYSLLKVVIDDWCGLELTIVDGGVSKRFQFELTTPDEEE